MDNSTVFIKTKEGEEAVRQRTRLVQRNLRNILIMVDGHATVDDLARRFGDANATDAALNELKACGFIAEMGGESVAVSESPPEAEPAPKVEDVPVLTAAIETSSSISPFSEPPSSLQHASLPPEFDDAPPDLQEYESLPPTFNPAEAWQSSPPPLAAAPNVLDKVKSATAGMGAKLADLAKRRAKAEEPETGPVEIEPIRRGPHLPVPWPVLGLMALAGLFVLSLLAAMLFPYERYLPDIERKAGAALQDPVKIGTIGFSILPRPHIALGNIRVGQSEHLTVSRAMAVPDFLSLLGDDTIVDELVLEKAVVKNPGLGRLARIAPSPGMTIRRIVLKDLGLAVGETVFGGMQGEMSMTASGIPEKILLRNAAETLSLDLTPKGEGFLLAVLGIGWHAPTRPEVVFNRIEAQGELKSNRLELAKLDGKAFDGLVEGSGFLDWSGVFRLKGELVLKRLNAASVLRAVGSDFVGEGELSGRMRLDGETATGGRLPEALRTDTAFEVGRGAIKGFDLGEAVRNTGRSATQGGLTKFEQLSGTLLKGPEGMRLGNLRLNSGLLQAGGNLSVAPDGQLNGAVEVELKASAKTLRVALLVGGTSKVPLLTPARGR